MTRKSSARSEAGWLLLLLLAAGPGSAELLPVPRPEPGSVAEEIQRQIDALEALIASFGEPADGAARELAEVYGTLGQLYHLFDMRPPAEACYKNARTLAPGDPRWPYSLALLHQAAGQAEAARARFEETLALRGDDLPSLIRLGRLELDAGRVARAGELFRRALELDPSSAAAAAGAGHAAAGGGDDRAAIAHFSRALELQGEASILHYPLAQALRRTGELERARHHLERRGLREVDFPDPVSERLRDLSTLAAFRLVQAMAARGDRFPEAELLGYALSLLANVEGTVERLERLLADWPPERAGRDALQRGRLHYVAGGLLVHRALDRRAAAHFRSAVALAPELQDARIKLANVLARSGAYGEAVAQLSIVLERQPSRSAARLKRAAALLAMGRPREALRDLERVLRADPENPEAFFRLGIAREQLGESEAAIERYLGAAQRSTAAEAEALARYRAARLLRRQGAFERAREQYERALAVQPDLAAARRELAELLASRGS